MRRLIDADALIDAIDKNPTLPSFLDVMRLIGKAPSIDIVRCKDCKHWLGFCNRIDGLFEPNDDDFCSYGERSE